MRFAILIAHVIGKEGFDALFAKVGWAKRSSTRTDCDVGQLETRLAAAEPTIVPVASLEVANHVPTSGIMVGEVTKCRHGIRCPTSAIFDPTGIRGELFEVPNHGLRQIWNTAVRANDAALGNQDRFVIAAKTIPCLGV